MCSYIWGRSKWRSAAHFNAHPQAPHHRELCPELCTVAAATTRHQSRGFAFVQFKVFNFLTHLGCGIEQHVVSLSPSSGDEEYRRAAEPISFPKIPSHAPKRSRSMHDESLRYMSRCWAAGKSPKYRVHSKPLLGSTSPDGA